MKIISYFFLLFGFVIITSSCNNNKKSLNLLKVTEKGASKLSDSALVKILKEETNLEIKITHTLSEDFAVKQLRTGDIDLLIMPNSIIDEKINFDFRTIAPLLPRILMVLTNEKKEVKDLKNLLENNIVIYEEMSRLDSLFFKRLYENFDIDEEKIKTKSITDLDLEKESDSSFVYVGLTHLHNLNVRNLVNHNWSMFSLDDVQNYGMGSKLEGFAMNFPSAYPFILPMSVYKGNPKQPILTLAIKDVLICKEELEEDLVYQIMETLIEKKSQLVFINNSYNLLDFDFEKQLLSFPLHEGTKNFLERNKPSIWMRYINMAWPILSILVIFIGAFTSFKRRLKKKNKENIENYYTSLLEIREKSSHIDSDSEIKELLNDMKLLRSRAIEALANNKFDSGESFNIFLALYTEIKNDLDEDLNDSLI